MKRHFGDWGQTGDSPIPTFGQDPKVRFRLPSFFEGRGKGKGRAKVS